MFNLSIALTALNSFSQMGIPYTLYYGSNYSQSAAHTYMTNVLTNPTHFFIYQGHGNNYTIGNPYYLFAGGLPSIGNSSTTPIGFGFACHLNSYNTNYSFGAEWVSSERSGGAAFYGATTLSYLSPNFYLALRMFEELKEMTSKISNFPLSLWLRLSEFTYYIAYSQWQREFQIKRYCLIGDPTLAVYGMNTYGAYAPFHMPKKDTITPVSSKISTIEFYDVSGKKVTVSSTHDISSIPLPSGVYVVKTLYEDGTSYTNKIIK